MPELVGVMGLVGHQDVLVHHLAQGTGDRVAAQLGDARQTALVERSPG